MMSKNLKSWKSGKISELPFGYHDLSSLQSVLLFNTDIRKYRNTSDFAMLFSSPLGCNAFLYPIQFFIICNWSKKYVCSFMVYHSLPFFKEIKVNSSHDQKIDPWLLGKKFEIGKKKNIKCQKKLPTDG